MEEDKAKQILKDKFLEYFAVVPIQRLACQFIGRSENTISDWKKDDPNFRDAIASLKAQWVKDKVSTVTNPMWLLERIVKEHFSPLHEHRLVDPESVINQILNRIDQVAKKDG